jgi:hypothetical protein
LESDFLAVVLARLLDGDRRHSEILCRCAKRTFYQRSEIIKNVGPASALTVGESLNCC